jgi:hypothetical protein
MSTSDLQLLDIEDVAGILKLTPLCIMEHTVGKKLPIIPSIRINRRVRRYRKSDIAAFLESCAVNAIKAEAK